MRRFAIIFLSTLVAGYACSGDSTGPGSQVPNVAGTYAGNTTGVSQGIALNATFSVTMTQNAGSVTGVWGLQGVLDNGVNTVPVAGNGPVSGSVAANGAVSLTIRTTACPNYQANFSGSFDGSNGRLTLTGPIEFLNASCTVVLSYPTTLILTR